MSAEEFPTTTVHGREVPYDPEQLRKIAEHPCYSEKACHTFGRCHLPVAPKCNIQCNYCIRDFDCVNESRPGVTSKVLSPGESLDLVRRVVREYPYVKVIGIAGPGEPLANSDTFETLRLVHEEFPKLIMCISTNGLLLPESIDELDRYGVGTITVTLNAIDPAIGEKIYSHVTYEGKTYHGREAAEILLSQQLKGIEMAVAKKMFVKINTVYIPGINDEHIVDIAKKVSEMGAYTFNVIPLIPQYKFADIVPPTPKEKKEMQDACARYIKQMRHCARCRSDAIGKLGQDVQSCIYRKDETE
ncbi:nitrogenase molybdenum-iron cofactor biosynthesis protein [Methanoculleus taiwanensis]|uniref:FeMo cofactor biosynthesis protein NifB n=1 Tax=Methanoculleus taiwanensis TaxID=1550565 RepID=A0A498GYT2_9EURY|nr:nitrogenase cofactor biosynthesis protein NifB [Methanoculleus taiwanensis]RXE55829.1 nitrogenase molybdenum-iron cofactor biosynthesis protein [Methanoculleus taiwanensis]